MQHGTKPAWGTALLALRDGTTRGVDLPLPAPGAVLESLVTGRAAAYSSVHVVYRRECGQRQLQYAYAGLFTAQGLPSCSACGASRAGLKLYAREADAAAGVTPMTPRLCEACYLAAP